VSAQTISGKTLSNSTISGVSTIDTGRGSAWYISNTTDTATNFEKGKVKFDNNVFEVGTIVGGTGTTREARFGVAPSSGYPFVQRYVGVSNVVPYINLVLGLHPPRAPSPPAQSLQLATTTY
jgi:hypothetical protein